ncbi:hypothetical protein PINS_up019381 [Pythium insidiosum]|nr:hypothetical protein PINS_up019381 [Pythium insidiosum]
MNASDEERCLLDDESMDEMVELEEALQTRLSDDSVLTRADRDGLDGSDEDDEDAAQQDSDSSLGAVSDSSLDDDSESETRMTSLRRLMGDAFGSDNGSSDAEDEPPEIPGSPLRATSPEVPAAMNRSSTSGLMNRLGDVDIGRCGELTRQQKEQEKNSVDILRITPRDNEDDEYQIRDSEQPRAMEFHSSSSSSEDDDEQNDSDDEDNQRHGRSAASTGPPPLTARPKTVASELAQYRDVLPADFYEQNGQVTQQDSARSTRTDHVISNGGNVSTPNSFVVRVPQEIQALFRHIDEYKPEELDLPTRLEPFIPDFVPTIGLPFDGIQVPRPDGKPDDTGISVVREPTAQSNTAELELLLRATAKRKRQRDTRAAVVHGIEDAVHRPREIDRWIAGVAKVQATQPPAQVIYKKPMPTLLALMEFWPESMSEFLSVTPLLALDKMDLTLEETIDVVCGVLDIPVYPQQRLHSLHLLFCLYHEIIMYEKEMLSTAQAPSRPP